MQSFATAYTFDFPLLLTYFMKACSFLLQAFLAESRRQKAERLMLNAMRVNR
jgi:hypothetical protein